MATPADEKTRLFWRNFLAHTIEGGLYMGGLQFVTPVVVLTYLVDKMNGPALLTAVVPTLMYIGFMAPPLFMGPNTEFRTPLPPVPCKGSSERSSGNSIVKVSHAVNGT